MCVSWCTTLVHNTAQNSSYNLLPYLPFFLTRFTWKKRPLHGNTPLLPLLSSYIMFNSIHFQRQDCIPQKRQLEVCMQQIQSLNCVKMVQISNLRDKCFHGRGCIFPASAANTRRGTEQSLAAWSSQIMWPHGPSVDQNKLPRTWLLHDCPTDNILQIINLMVGH